MKGNGDSFGCTHFIWMITMDEVLGSLTKQIDQLLAEREQVIVAIDGSCAAGKTTLANALAKEYDCNVFRMDDFFLRPEQRTAERYAQPGGNVDYERFREEVLIPLMQVIPFSYRPFSCTTFTLSDPVEVAPRKLTIIEGTYCLHPCFGDVFDWKVFMSVDPQLQRSRILRRPQWLHERFFNDWIPMEQHYFDFYHIKETCDMVF